MPEPELVRLSEIRIFPCQKHMLSCIAESTWHGACGRENGPRGMLTGEVSRTWKDAMTPQKSFENGIAWRKGALAEALFCIVFLAQPIEAQSRDLRSTSAPRPVQSAVLIRNKAADTRSSAKAGLPIPLGTILPVRLNSSLSSLKSKPGQIISARIMQSVPLANGAKIRQGSRVVGHIVEVSAGAGASPAQVSLLFDKLLASKQTIPITTNLRAIAGFMDVFEAQTPTIPAGEGDNYYQCTTVQVGGDVVFGWGGPVTRGDDTSQVVGKAVAGGVLSRISGKEGTKCRGAMYGNESPQALWVFSSDACGVYGIAHLEVLHAGRSDPVGLVVLRSDTNDLKIRSGAGMLLRINEVGK